MTTAKLEKHIGGSEEMRQVTLSVTSIDSPTQAEQVAEMGRIAHLALKDVEADLDSIVRPLNEGIRAARAVAAKSIKPLKDVKERCKRLLDQWREIENKRLLEGKAAVRKAAAERAPKEEIVELAKQARPVEQPAKTHVRESYSYEIVDEEKVPQFYWKLDDAKLSKLARSTKGTAEVPGVKFIVKQTTVFR